jgi:endonuclease YncB( thermonuclease family)
MKPCELTFRNQNSQHFSRRLVLVVLLVLVSGCATADPPVSSDAADSNEPESLECRDCELVDVVEVKDANTIITSFGEIQMYGAYVIDQPEDCATKAEERLRNFVGSEIRIEPGPAQTIRVDSGHYYIYTKDGLSIEEQLVREGLALIWGQDGQHLGWFVYLDSAAKEHESGCFWKGWNAFQRGEPSNFRIPGLAYSDSD